MLLMHKNEPVADLNMYLSKVLSVNAVYRPELMPWGTEVSSTFLLPKAIDAWQAGRSIPKERQDVHKIEERLGCSVSQALYQSLGVSLTDCYWYKESDSVLQWEDVTFYGKDFSEDFYRIAIAGENVKEIDFRSPDYTTDGVLKKAWLNIDGIPTLIKFGDLGEKANKKNLLSANEVAAYRISGLMGIDHAQYYPVKIAETSEFACATSTFISDDRHEFINGLSYGKHEKMTFDLYNLFVKNGMQSDVDKMIVFDFLIHNTDRHEKNFGVLRDSATFELIGFAPLFDSGSSFFWNNDKNFTKPFKDDRLEQLSIVEKLPCDIPDYQEVKNILQSSYELFGIEERVFDSAVKDLNSTYETLRNFEHNILIKDREDPEL